MKHNYEYSNADVMNENEDLVMSKTLHKALDRLAKRGCLRMVFSRFPYYNSKMQCKKLAMHKREGNCVAFAYYMKTLLKQHKLNAFIVGAKIPPKFSRRGYRDICHTGVVLPYSSGCVLFDTAFYFDRAIVLDKSNDYKQCLYFTNVYSHKTDKWCFTLINNMIHVHINDVDVDAYYEIKELINPYKSVTLHTNSADKTVFRCEVDKNMLSKFYYKLNLVNNTLSVNSHTQNTVHINVTNFFNSDAKLNEKVLKEWIFNLNLENSQKQKMYTDVRLFLKRNKATS